MPDYAKARLTAQRLINGAGRDVTVVKLTSAAADPLKPHRGPTDPRAASVLVGPIKAAFVDPVNAGSLGFDVRDDDFLKSAEKVIAIAAEDDGGEDLETFHEVRDGATTWRIAAAKVLQPGVERLIYGLAVKR